MFSAELILKVLHDEGVSEMLFSLLDEQTKIFFQTKYAERIVFYFLFGEEKPFFSGSTSGRIDGMNRTLDTGLQSAFCRFRQGITASG